MIIQDLKSNTDEWLRHRRLHNNASEAPMMMGASKNVSRNELLHMKSTGLDRELSDWFQKNILDNGHAVEASARPIAEKIVGEELFPVSATDDEDWLAASFDGQTMLEDKNWECKQWNEQKAADVREGKVPECDYWQLVHQQAVNPGSETLYMVTDGTEEKCVYVWFKAPAADIKRLKAGWIQFEKDLAEYVPPEAPTPEPEGKAPDALPALSVQVQGMVTASNLREFEESAMATLAGINTDLKTDNDFADAEKAVKFCKDVESRLDGAKSNVLGQMQTVDEVVRTIDRIKEETRQIRLKLDKAVKEQKEQRKLEILNSAKTALNDCLGDLVSSVKQCMPPIHADFAGVMKGKKTIKSLKSACDDELARAKIEIHEAANRIQGNLQQIDEHAADYQFLFSDLPQIANKPAEDFAAIVKSRIADHKEAEQKRLDAEREKIRQEEEARAQREAAQKAQHDAMEAEKARAAKVREEQQATQDEPAQGKKPAYKMPPLEYASPQPERIGDASHEDDKVLIDRAEYSQLLDDSALLAALMAAGVDNWEGYGVAIEMKQEAA